MLDEPNEVEFPMLPVKETFKDKIEKAVVSLGVGLAFAFHTLMEVLGIAFVVIKYGTGILLGLLFLLVFVSALALPFVYIAKFF